MPLTRTTDPHTSHEAEHSVGRLRESHAAIYRLFEYVGAGMTDTTLVEIYPVFQEEHPELPEMSPSGLRTRRKELVEECMIRDSGEHEILPTNRKAIVWELNDYPLYVIDQRPTAGHNAEFVALCKKVIEGDVTPCS